MKAFCSKIIFVTLWCFFLSPLNIGWANKMKGDYEVTKPLVLYSLSGYGVYNHYEDVKIFIDAENNTIVLSSFAFRNNEDWRSKVLLFVFNGKQWVKSENTSLGIQCWGGMINNGHFQVYTINDLPEIYSLNYNMKLSTEPIKEVKTNGSKKVFKDENNRNLRELLPVEEYPDNFFIIGHYRESRLLNPANLARFLTSGGHWGFVTRLYGATFEQDKVTGYYNIPEKLKANHSLSSMDSILSGNKVHIVWVKDREYTSEPEIIQYSYFDLSKKQWNEITELFKGYKYSERTFNVFSSPSLACDNGNVYCVWSWLVTDRTDIDKPVRLKESGVYFCSKMGESWNKPIKLADLGVQPQVITDNNGDVYVFWIEEYKGLFFKHRTHTGWSNTNLLVKDVTIRTKEAGLPGTSPPFSIAVDSDNRFHIAYIRAASGFGGEDFMPEQLIYVKLTGSRNSGDR